MKCSFCKNLIFHWDVCGCQHSFVCCCWNQNATLPCVIPSQSIATPCPQVKPKAGNVFLLSFSSGQIYDEINFLNLTETQKPLFCCCLHLRFKSAEFFSVCWGTWRSTSHAYSFFQFLPWLSFPAARLWLSLINVWKLGNSPPTSSNSPALSHSLWSFWHLFWVSLLSRGSHNTTCCWGTKIIKVSQKCTKGIPLRRKRSLRFHSD